MATGRGLSPSPTRACGFPGASSARATGRSASPTWRRRSGTGRQDAGGAGARRCESLARVPAGTLVGIERTQEVLAVSRPRPVKATGRKRFRDPPCRGSAAIRARRCWPRRQGASGGDRHRREAPDSPPPCPASYSAARQAQRPVGRFTVARSDEFAATDAALADDGTVYLLERRFDLLRGVALRLRRFPLGMMRPGL